MNYEDASTRFGSATWSTEQDLKNAGLLNHQGVHYGFTRNKHAQPIRCNGTLSRLYVGVAGSGKLSTVIGYQLRNPTANLVVVDVKPELGEVSALDIHANKYYLNGYGIGTEAPWFLTMDTMNPLDFSDPSKPTYFDDMDLMAKSVITKPTGNSSNAEHFYGKAVMVTHAVLMDGKAHHPHFSLPDLYNVTGDLQTGGGLHFEMHISRMKNSRYNNVRQVANELESKAKMGPAEFGSIMSTISNSLRNFGNPTLAMMMSGKSTITPQDFIRGDRPNHLFIRFPESVAENNASAIRAIITALFVEQQRSPVKPLHYILDESFILGAFHMILKICYLGRGSLQTASIFVQNYGQLLHNFGENQTDTILSNCPYKLILGVGSEKTGKFAESLAGTATYRYVSKSKQHEAAFKRTQAARQLLRGQNLTQAMLEFTRQDDAMDLPEAVARPIIKHDEVMRKPQDMGLFFAQDKGIMYRTRQRHYFLDKSVAHLYLPNRFHPPTDRIYIPGAFGKSRAVKIISEKVPPEIAHLPQYAGGYWSYPQGFNPLKTRRFKRFSR